MRRLSIVLAVSLAAGAAWAQGKEPLALRDMGSFHVGGRVIEIAGQPIKEIVFTPGGVPAKMDPNGKYQVEQMYVQYFLPKQRKGKLPLLMWHGGGLTGVTWETKPDGQPRRCLNVHLAGQRLGFRPAISLEDGIERTIAWYRRHHHGIQRAAG